MRARTTHALDAGMRRRIGNLPVRPDVAVVEAQRTIKGKVERERRYYISSLDGEDRGVGEREVPLGRRDRDAVTHVQ